MKNLMYRKALLYLVGVSVCFFLITETYFRSPWVAGRLQYEFDEQLKMRYRPSQDGVISFLGNYSVQTPRIQINSDAFRGPEVRRGALPRVVIVGSSQVMGAGMAEDETLAASLEDLLRKCSKTVQVNNLGVGGYGPGHHAVVLRRFTRTYNVDHIWVRVSIGDRDFRLPSMDELKRERKAKMSRDLVLNYVRSSQYLYNRLLAQVSSIKQRTILDLVSRDRRLDRFDNEERYRNLAETMWSDYLAAWREVADIAEAANAKLVFYIPNIDENAGQSLLYERMTKEFAATKSRTRVIYFGSDEFGLSNVALNQLPNLVKENYTLGFDPHSNARYYKELAGLIARHLDYDESTGLRCKTVR